MQRQWTAVLGSWLLCVRCVGHAVPSGARLASTATHAPCAGCLWAGSAVLGQAALPADACKRPTFSAPPLLFIQGDSGSPLVWKSPSGPAGDVAVGIVSWAIGCYVDSAVFADLAAGSQWIRNTTQVGGLPPAMCRHWLGTTTAGWHGWLQPCGQLYCRLPSPAHLPSPTRAACPTWAHGSAARCSLVPCRSGCCMRTRQGASQASPRGPNDGLAIASPDASLWLLATPQPFGSRQCRSFWVTPARRTHSAGVGSGHPAAPTPHR